MFVHRTRDLDLLSVEKFCVRLRLGVLLQSRLVVTSEDWTEMGFLVAVVL